MKSLVRMAVLIWLLSALRMTAADRINQEGRILGPLPVMAGPILFDTSNADAVVSAMQIFPVTNPWNECVSNLPVLVNSDAMIAQINSDVGSSHRRLELFQEMNFVLVPDDQPLVPFEFMDYPERVRPERGNSRPFSSIRSGGYAHTNGRPVRLYAGLHHPDGRRTPTAATGIPSSCNPARGSSGKLGYGGVGGLSYWQSGQRHHFQFEHEWPATRRLDFR